MRRTLQLHIFNVQVTLHTLMYLKSLFQQSRPWFFVVMIFIACQLFINFKHGVVFSPFYHYGMYSEVIKPRASYKIFSVIADGTALRAQDFSPQQWDKIIQPLLYDATQQEANTAMFTEVHRLTGIGDSNVYINDTTRDFLSWYREYLGSILHRRINVVTVQSKTYQP